jgi:hypothetical protein
LHGVPAARAVDAAVLLDPPTRRRVGGRVPAVWKGGLGSLGAGRGLLPGAALVECIARV